MLMVWCEQVDLHYDCYFCMTKISGFSRKNKSKIVNPGLKPVLHDFGISMSILPAKSGFENEKTYESTVV